MDAGATARVPCSCLLSSVRGNGRDAVDDLTSATLLVLLDPTELRERAITNEL